jgi:glycosyltransferase involved in cell wall biosynthesis
VTKPGVFLSVIFPAHNEADRLPRALEQTITYLEGQSYLWEILVVENGSRDATFEIASSFAAHYPTVRVLREHLPGKGRAVRAGVLAARGDWRFICDVDLSMPVTEINRFLPPNVQADIVIASREGKNARRFNEPAYRHLIGRIFNLIVRILALPGLHDSQCGFKCFSAGTASQLFPLQTINGWTFDVELLYIARLRGFRVVELGIPWYHDPHSKVKVLCDSARMMLDLFKIRWNHLRGKYAP